MLLGILLSSVFARKGSAAFFSSSSKPAINYTDTSCSIAPLLRWCALGKPVRMGMQAHHQVVKEGLEKGTFLGNLLLHVYFRCGALHEALALFWRMDARNDFSWRIIIVALAQHKHIKEAFHLFEEMLCKGLVPDRMTIITIITDCCSLGYAYSERGNVIHYLILILKLDADTVISNTLITMYGRNESLPDARHMFNIMPSRDVVSWNAMITAYVNKDHYEEAISLFRQMDLTPNNLTFLCILSAFSCPSTLEFGVHVHGLILAGKYKSDVSVNNALISMYGRCGCLEGAAGIFEGLQERNTISWTTILAVHADNGDETQAFQAYTQMLQECVTPTNFTFVTYLNLCMKKEALASGKQIHACLAKTQQKGEVVVETALVNLYGKCGHVKMASEIFHDMVERNVVSWGTIIAVNVQHDLAKEAFQYFQQMQQEGELPDRVIYLSMLDSSSSQANLKRGEQLHACLLSCAVLFNVFLATALVRLYVTCSQLRAAEDVFTDMRERNVFSWNAITSGYLQIGESELLFGCFGCMQQEAISPDDVSFVNLLSVCGAGMALAAGIRLHVLVGMNEFLSNIIIWNALVSMYGRCCKLRDAQRVFERIPERNSISWNAIIAAFAQNGCTSESLTYLKRMELEGFGAENSTFLAVLSACSHGGFANEAFQLFDSMIYDFGIKSQVDHYNCLIDLLARAGRLDEAEMLLTQMPCMLNFISLMTVLTACRLQNDTDRGQHIAMRACLAEPCNIAPLVALSNLYAVVENCKYVERGFASIEYMNRCSVCT